MLGRVLAFDGGLGAHGLVFVSQGNIGSPLDPRSTGWTTALDASSGQVVWSKPEGWNGGLLVGATLFAYANRHIGDAGDFTGTIAFDALTGAERFRIPGFVAQAAADGTVFGGYLSTVGAVPIAGCGTPACFAPWVADYDAAWTGNAAVANGWLYLAGVNGLAVFPASGCGQATCAPAWTASGSYGGIAVAGDRLFLNDDWLHGTGPNVLHVFDARGVAP